MCQIIFHLFRFYYAKMRIKSWPKSPAKEGALGQMSKSFQVYLIEINFFKKPNNTILSLFTYSVCDEKVKINHRAKELYCDATIIIFDSLLSSC